MFHVFPMAYLSIDFLRPTLLFFHGFASYCKGASTSVCECEEGMRDGGECQKVAYSAFAAQANEQSFRWLFIGCPNECTSTSVQWRMYFSLKYQLQMDSVRLFVEHMLPHK